MARLMCEHRQSRNGKGYIMRKKMYARALAIVLAISMVGCGSNNTNIPSFTTSESLQAETGSVEIETSSTSEVTIIDEVTENEADVISTENPEDEEESIKAEEEAQRKAEEERKQAEEEALQKAEEEKKLVEQRNSFSMMYYLAITAEEIRTSKDNRIALEDIYTSLLNDINPGAIDEITQDHLKNLRDIIKSYLDISTKRDRLQFIYNQEKAAAIRDAVPNPLAILSISNALDWRKLAMTVAYTAIDSYNNYKKAGESTDLAFIMSGWELDDEEKATVMKNRNRAFDYMVDMTQEYNLDV